jgi:capsule polysaccharide export protein KpsC/LpsZ
MLGYRRLFRPASIAEAQVADLFAAWGGAQGEQRKLRLARWARRLQCPFVLLEDGLFRSVEIGLTGTPTVSIILDDRSAYYDATRASRLERLLASSQRFTGKERGRAGRCIRRIVEQRLSKYNHAPDRLLPFAPGSVLVVDQRKGDLSVTRGLGDESSFREMLLSACRENPDRPILIKRHPDAVSGGKSSYFSDDVLKSLGPLPNVQLIDYEICPHALFDCCEKVYVVTSGMGFEALLRGLEVHCFGIPFYSGWGLTHDRKTVARRKRKRRLEEVFYAICILHSRYYDPRKQRPCSLESALDYLTESKQARAAH